MYAAIRTATWQLLTALGVLVAVWITLAGTSAPNAATPAGDPTLVGVAGKPIAENDSTPAAASSQSATSDAIVYLSTTEAGGTGFFVNPTQLLTAAHVVESSDSIGIRLASGQWTTGHVTARDRDLDVAVVTLTGQETSASWLDWQRAPTPDVTDSVIVWGYPHESQLVGIGFNVTVAATTGIVSAYRLRNDVAYLQTDAAMNPGNSGGPMTRADGSVVGLNTFIFSIGENDPEGINFALDLAQHRAQVQALLDAVVAPPPPAS